MILRGLAWLIGTVVVAVVLLVGYLFCGPSASQNYRLSVVVDDNGREIVGSSVYRTFIRVNGFDTPYSMEFTGERVVVDLGEKGLLFATTSDNWAMYPEWYLAPLYHIDSPTYDRIWINRQINKLPEGSGLDLTESLPERIRATDPGYHIAERERPNRLPLLIRFRDISDPNTAEKVDLKNLEATYGPGVHLVRIRLETTTAPVSRSVEPDLPWMRKSFWISVPGARDYAPREFIGLGTKEKLRAGK